MKKLAIAALLIGLLAAGCANTGYYNTQKGALAGAGLGALAGQAIGRDTESTLLGAGVGAFMGAVVGNGMDQDAQRYRDSQRNYAPEPSYYSSAPRRNYAPEPSYYSSAPRRSHANGRWVNVPGHWEGPVWVPRHTVWRPYF